MTNPSILHKNNQRHNWIVYKIMDKFLCKYSFMFKGKIYDLGCGETPYRTFLLSFANKYIGVDWGNSLHNLNADIIADLNKPLPIESEVADTIFSISVIEHLYNPQMMLNEAFRILKPGGNIILQVPWQWGIHEAPYDYFRFSPYALKFMFEQAGFSILSIEPTAGFFTTFILKFNYFTLRIINRQKRIMRGILKLFFVPLWYINQTIAPSFDKLDKDWSIETQGYFITAKKMDNYN